MSEVKRLRAMGAKALGIKYNFIISLGKFVDEELNPIEDSLLSTDLSPIVKEAFRAIRKLENSTGYKRGLAKLKSLNLEDDDNWLHYKMQKAIAARSVGEKKNLLVLPPIFSEELLSPDFVAAADGGFDFNSLNSLNSRRSSLKTNSIDDILERLKTSSISKPRSHLKTALVKSIISRRQVNLLEEIAARKASQDRQEIYEEPSNLRARRRSIYGNRPSHIKVSESSTSVFLTETSVFLTEVRERVSLKALMKMVINCFRFIKVLLLPGFRIERGWVYH
jgi:hypothetical protein